MNETSSDSEFVYRSLVNCLPQNIFRKDAEGRFTFVNEQFCRTVNRPQEEILGRTDFDLFPEALATKYVGDDARVMETGENYHVIEEHETPDRGLIFVEVTKTAVRDANGTILGVQGIFSDVTEREQAQQALRESAAGFSMVFRVSPAAISLHVLETGRLIEVNDRCCRTLGYEREELIGHSILELRVWAKAEDRKTAGQRLRAEGSLNDFETTLRRKSGELLTVLVSMELIDLAGEPEPAVLSMFIDITERKRAEAALVGERHLLRTVIDNLPANIFAKDLEGRYLLSNEAHLHLTGVKTEAELFGKTVFDFFPPEIAREYDRDDKLLFRLARAVLDREEPFELKGERGWYATTKVPLRDASKRVIGLVGIKHDITERKRQEAERFRLAERMQLLLESAGEGIFGMDLAGLCTFSNRAGAAMLGRGPEELIGQDLHALTQHHRPSGDDYPVAECPITAVPVSGNPCRREDEVFWRKDGASFPVAYAAYPIREAGVVTGVVVTFTDITQKKELEEQFLRSQRMDAIGTLASGIAHDLNNALAPILIGTDILRDHCKSGEALETLETMRKSANRGAGMVKQLLAFARGSEGSRAPVQLRHLFKEIVAIIRQTFFKTINLHHELPKDLWEVHGDPTQLHQILLNLCVNARDAMAAGGQLMLSARNAQLERDAPSLPAEATPGPYVVMSVSDTGTGMTPEVRTHIFDAFFTTKSRGQGTGLGLSTVHTITKNHGGFVTVYSEVGRGTRVSVYLPAVIQSKTEPPAPAAATILRGQGELILVVDDDDSILKSAKRSLERMGYRVLTARDGAAALDVAQQYSAELKVIVTDLDMPIMDGATAISSLQQFSPHIAIVASSGLYGSSGDTERLALKVAAFLPKPYGVSDLLGAVQTALQSKSKA